MLKPLIPFFCLIVGISQAQELVKDINANHDGQLFSPIDFSQVCRPCGGYVYFPAKDKEHGRELWRTDGTSEGTIRLTDIGLGTADGIDEFAITTTACSGGILYFGNGNLYRSDGSPAGTVKIVDGAPTPPASFPSSPPAPFLDKVAFGAGNSIYLTDPEGGTPTVLKEFEPVSGATTIQVHQLKAGVSKLYAAVLHRAEITNAVVAVEVWASDGTTTTLVYAGDRITLAFDVLNDKLFFHGHDDDHGSEWWVSDGTPGGTELLVDEDPGPDESFSPTYFMVDDKFIFATGTTTWVSFGTPATTNMVLNAFSPFYLEKFHDKLYMSAYGPSGWHLGRTDLDLSNFEEIVPNAGTSLSGLITVAGDKLLYSYEDPTDGVELFSVDEVSGALTLVKDINTGSNFSSPRSFAEIGGQSVFVAEDADHGFEFWVTDGTETGTLLLQDIAEGTPSAEMSGIYQYNKKLYFLARSTPDQKRELWTSDGSDAGTRIIFQDPDLFQGTIFGVNQNVITSISGVGFVKVDVDTEDNIALNLPPGYNNFAELPLQLPLVVGNIGFFNTDAAPTVEESNGVELWTVDVSTNDITFVKDINPGAPSSDVLSNYATAKGLSAVLNGKVIFPAKTPDGIEPWVSDGTEEGTIMLMDIASGSSFPRAFVAMGDNVYFVASGDAQGREVWVTDGTPEGTHILKDIAPGAINGVNENQLAVYNDILLFVASEEGNTFNRLWMSDGTEEGTVPYDLLPAGWKLVSNVVAAGNNFYFTANHPDHGVELWTSDGTPEGTVLIELEPGVPDSFPEHFVNDNGTLYFTANRKIWRTQGDLSTTAMLGIIGEEAPVDELFVTDNYVCFVWDDQVHGQELFRAGLNGPVGQLIMFTGFTDLQPGEEYDISVDASSGLPVVLESSDPSIIEISGNKIIVHKGGSVVFTATQDGDASFNPASATLEVVVQPLAQTITFAPIADKTPLDAAFSVEATTTSGLTLIFESSNTLIAEISAAGEITIKTPGNVTITASQPGNDSYAAATPVSRSFDILKVSQTLTFNELPSKTFGDAPFALTATATSGLAVTYSTTNDQIQITAANVTMIAAGSVTIKANQPGDDVYSAALPIERTFCINPAKATITQTGTGAEVTLTSSSSTNVWKRNDVTLAFPGKSFKVTESGVYKAAGTADGCQGEFSDVANVVVTGLEDLNNGVEIFPNPTDKQITVRCPAQSQIRIMDLTGKEQINEITRGSESVIDVSSFAAGMYFIVVKDETQTHYSKFLKR